MITIGQRYNFTLNGNHLAQVVAMAVQPPFFEYDPAQGEKVVETRKEIVLCRRMDNASPVLAFASELSEPAS